MRSREIAWLLCALALAAGLVTVHGQDSSPPAGVTPTAVEIERAMEQIRADPDVSGTRTIRTLRWRETDSDWTMPGWLRWLANLFSFLGQSGRVLVLLAVAAGIVMLVVFLSRTLSSSIDSAQGGRLLTPTHVRDLDIRPESLPDDVGAAARALWDAGEHRSALALLYRGLLSRLAHAHRVPIRDSSTEGDCLALAAGHLEEARFAYASRLVRVWQRAVYGGLDPDAPVVYELCAGFSGALDPVPSPRGGREAAA